MTEKEVLSKLDVFKNAIIKLKNDKKSLERALEEKDKELKSLSESKDAEVTCSEDLRKDIDALTSLVKENKEELSKKESIIESKDEAILELKTSLSELKGYSEGKDKEIERLSNLLNSNNNLTLPDNSKMEEALMSLSKQFQDFVPKEDGRIAEMESKLNEANKVNEELKSNLSSKDTEIENIKSSKDKELDDMKKDYDGKIKTLTDSYESELKSTKETMNNLVSENKSLREDNVNVDRVKESLKEALKVKKELLVKNQELSEKIKRLEDIMNLEKSNNHKKIVKREVTLKAEEPVKEEAPKEEKKEEEPKQTYRFGRTSKSVMDKVDSFLDSLYSLSTKDSVSGITTLSDTLKAKESNNLTDKEYEVFIDRLTSLDYDGSLLFWIDTTDNKLKTIADLGWVKTYISRII